MTRNGRFALETEAHKGRRMELISESIQPVRETGAVLAMASGEPGLPHRFIWRGVEYAVDAVLERWREVSDGTRGEPGYVRKHWFEIRTTSGHRMRIYCERQPRSKRERHRRWWLYTMSPPEGE